MHNPFPSLNEKMNRIKSLENEASTLWGEWQKEMTKFQNETALSGEREDTLKKIADISPVANYLVAYFLEHRKDENLVELINLMDAVNRGEL